MAQNEMKTKAEIEEMICKLAGQMDQGSKFPGMSYEDGVDAALRWVLGEDPDPMEG